MLSVKGTGAYARKRAAMEPDPLKRAGLAGRYSKARQRLARFENQVKPCVDALPGIRGVERNSLMNLARKVYGLCRRYDAELLPAYVVRAWTEWVRRECDPGRVMAIIVRSLSVRGVRLSDAEQAQLRKDIESNREGIMSSTEKQVIVNAAPAKPRSPRRFVKLEEGDLSSRVREYFARNIDDARLAESAAAELMTELQAGGKTAKSAKTAKVENRSGEDSYHKDTKSTKRTCHCEERSDAAVSSGEIATAGDAGHASAASAQRPCAMTEAPSVKRPAAGVRRTGLSLSEIDQPSAFGLFTRKQATTALRDCLAVHEPIVRRCVALRLTRLLTPEEIAAQLELELEDVDDILTQMRPWVHKFTGFFDQDRYWRDDAPRYSIPPLPKSGA